MRWQKRAPVPIGTTRTMVKLALFPTTMDDDTVVWLEEYNELQTREVFYDWDSPPREYWGTTSRTARGRS